MSGKIHFHKDSKELVIAYKGSWLSIIPYLQHNYYAENLLSNQYDALIDIENNGRIIPNIASQWTIENDYKKIIFKINIKKRFSNGEYLSAQHIKDSLEYGLKHDSISYNKSSLDGLYQLVGFDELSEKGHISGIEVQDNETLVLNYKTSFRRVLDHLSGTRFAIFIVRENKFLGTGRYDIEEIKKGQVALLRQNPYHDEVDKIKEIRIEVMRQDDAIAKIKNNEIDVIEFINESYNAEVKNINHVDSIFLHEYGHFCLGLNSLENKLFSKKEHRLAFQYLLIKNIDKNKILNCELDHQVYLSSQQGRISEDEVNQIIESGAPYVDDLIKATFQSPVRFVYSGPFDWIKDLLIKSGITLTKDSGYMEWSVALNKAYQTGEIDLLLFRVCVVNGDPDGLYHLLGKNGTILFPMNYRESVADLLEEGREISAKSEQIHKHYQEVSKEILKEVPFVHIGFVSDFVFYNKNSVRIEESYTKSLYHKVHNYKLVKS